LTIPSNEFPPLRSSESPPVGAPAIPRLSIVIPAFNEAARIGPTLEKIAWFADAEDEARLIELILSDDGSTDDTIETVTRLWSDYASQRVPLVVRSHPRNQGKGAAVRAGVHAAAGDWILITDADLSTPLSEFSGLASALRRGADIAIASRDLPGSRLMPPQSRFRRWLAGIFRWMRRSWLLPGIRDTQCGFKLIRRDRAAPVIADCREDGWVWDCEFLALADRRGLRIVEVAVQWRNHEDSRVRPIRDIPAVLAGLWRVSRRIGRSE